jgi:hypothetical protein
VGCYPTDVLQQAFAAQTFWMGHWA